MDDCILFFRLIFISTVSQAHFGSLVLNIKLSALSNQESHLLNSSYSVSTLYTDAKMQGLDFNKWPRFIADKLMSK